LKKNTGQDRLPLLNYKKNIYLRHSGVVYLEAIISAKGTEDRGFESRQVVRFLGLNALIAMLFFVT
jgi:hypothetical protein